MSQRAIRLHEQYTRADLVMMQRSVLDDPQYRNDGDGIHMLNSKGRKLYEDLGWAAYWHLNPQGGSRTQVAPAQTRWW